MIRITLIKPPVNKLSRDAWTHLSTEENSQVNLRSTYDVGAIPLRILIDRDGKMFKRWRGADEKHVKELTTILKSIK